MHRHLVCLEWMKNARGALAMMVLAHLLWLAPAATGQQATGGLQGEVAEAGTGRYLAGAVVKVGGTDWQAVTDRTGRFDLSMLPAGSYTVTVQYPGYESAVEAVTVRAGQVAGLTVELGGEVAELEAFRVEGYLGSQARALGEQQAAQNLKNVISADTFGQLPDKTIADTLKRLPGVNVEQDQGRGEARYVTIRGMNADFNAVSINGQRTMVANFDGASRSVPLDVVSAKNAESIEVTKSVTPDQDGDGVGGAVNIRTRSAFDTTGRHASFEATYGWNALAGTYSGDYPHDGNPYELSATYSQYLDPEKKWGLLVSANFRDRPFLIQGVSTADFQEITDSAVPELAGVYIPGDLQLEEAFDNIESTGVTLNGEYRPSEASRYSLDVNYSLRRSHTGSNRANMIYFPDVILEGEVADVVNNTLTDFVSDDRVIREVRDYFEDQEVLNAVFSGRHRWAENTLSYQAGYNRGVFEGSEEDDARARFRSGFGDNAYRVDPDDGYFPEADARLTQTAAGSYNFQWYRGDTRAIEDEEYSARVDFKREMELGGLAGFLQAGVKVLQRERDFDDISKRWETLSGATWNLTGIRINATGEQIYGSMVADYGPEDSVDGRYDFGLMVDPVKVREGLRALIAAGQRNGTTYVSRNVNRDNARGQINSYEAEETVLAGYVMGQVRRGDFSLLGGARVESTQVEFNGTKGDFFDPASLEPSLEENDYVDVLPGLHARWDLAASLVLRASVNSTLARASFRQLNPSADVDPTGGSAGNGIIFTGDTGLDPTQSWNYDLALDYSFGRFGFVSGGVFLKDMKDNVYRITKTLTAGDPEFAEYDQFGILPGAELNIFQNAEGAQVFGLEAAAEIPLEMLPSPLDGLRVFGNTTWTESEVDFKPGTQPNRNGRKTPLFGQVDLTWNLGVSYQKYGFEARVAWTRTDDYLLFNGLAEDPELDRYAAARNRLDLSASYKVGDQWKLFVEVQNALNDPIRAYRGDERVRMYYSEFSDLAVITGVRWLLD